MKKYNLFIGKQIFHIGYNENEGKAYKAVIIGFDRLAIKVKRYGATYFINSWELCDENGNMLK